MHSSLLPVHLVPGGGCTWSQGGVPGPRGVYLDPGGVSGPRGMYLVPGGVPGPRRGGPAQVPPPRGQTHTCKNITFATSLRTVNIVDTKFEILNVKTLIAAEGERSIHVG